MDPLPTTFAARERIAERGKAPELDEDRTRPLTAKVAKSFVAEMNAAFASPKGQELLQGERAQLFATIITHEKTFPFTAAVLEGNLQLAPDLASSPQPVLKNLSDGLTETSKKLSATIDATQLFRFELAQLLQPALYHAYLEAGMSEGPHTKYTSRGC